MEIKDLLGSDYKEGMTIEEINAALAGKTFVDPTTLGKTVSKETFDKTASELAEAKRKLDEQAKAGLSETERLKAALEEAEEAKRGFAIKSNRMDVEKIFLTAGLSDADYTPFIDGIVSEDAAASVSIANAIVKTLAAQKKATDAAVRKELFNGAAKPAADHGDPAMTLTDFRKLSPTERLEFSMKHPEQYQKMYEGE